jgi:hypothetical protein
MPPGISAEQLHATVIAGRFGHKEPAKPITVKTFIWEDRPWICTRASSGGDQPAQWRALPLIEAGDFAERYPDIPMRRRPHLPDKATDEDRRQYYTGIMVHVGKKLYRIAPASEERTISAPLGSEWVDVAGEPEFPAGPPEDGVSDPHLVSVSELDLPDALWRKLNAQGLPCVGDLTGLRDIAGGALADALVQTAGLKPAEADRVVDALSTFLESVGVRRCRVCGCTDADCEGCIERTGDACTWVEDDLCSACVENAQAKPAAKKRQKARVP